MDNYQPNSHKAKAEQKEANTIQKRASKVISGSATVKKKSELSKFKDVFISEDAANVKSYILMDLLIPGLKKLTVSMIKSAAEIIFGETGVDRGSSNSSRLPYVSYNSYSSKSEPRRYNEQKVRTRYNVNDITLENRGEAEAVLDQMHGMLADYGMVSVGDFYDLVGISSEYTDYSYGWTRLPVTEPTRLMGGGYSLNLPRPVSLK